MTKETVVLKVDAETKRILLRLTKALERFNPVPSHAVSGRESGCGNGPVVGDE